MLWLLNFFPVWVFHGILAAGVVALIVGAIANKIPPIMQYGLVLKLVGIVMIIAGLQFEGALSLKKDYDLQEAALKEQLLIAQAKGETIVTKVVEQIVYRDRTIVKQGADVVTYIDKWHEAIDKTCTLSKEAVKALNDAAKEPVDTGAAK
jgi:Zn-dependent protease